jgi:GNAT superfamily N-acetyltransferase
MLKIRRAVRDDATPMMLVRREAILAKAAAHYDQIILNDWAGAPDMADRVAEIRKKISDPNYIVIVAEADEEIIGFATAAPSKHELQALYTQPNPIGHVGRALLAAVEDLAFEAAEFLTCDASLNAERFYRANGYREERRKDHVSSSGAVIFHRGADEETAPGLGQRLQNFSGLILAKTNRKGYADGLRPRHRKNACRQDCHLSGRTAWLPRYVHGRSIGGLF